jgi:hypothetical protein
MERVVGFSTAETSKKEILEGANGSFVRDGTMDDRWYKMIVDVFLDNIVLENGGTFLVKALDFWLENGQFKGVCG